MAGDGSRKRAATERPSDVEIYCGVDAASFAAAGDLVHSWDLTSHEAQKALPLDGVRSVFAAEDMLCARGEIRLDYARNRWTSGSPSRRFFANAARSGLQSCSQSRVSGFPSLFVR